MEIGITLPQNIQGTCILLPSLTNERHHLKSCLTIANESNVTNSNQPFLLP